MNLSTNLPPPRPQLQSSAAPVPGAILHELATTHRPATTDRTRHSVVSVVRSYGVRECETSGSLAPPAQRLRAANKRCCETRSSEESFPYVAGWAGEDPGKAVAATQARVATAASQIIDASPAAHLPGGRPPGVEAAVAAAQTRREGLRTRIGGSTQDPATCEQAAQVGVGL
jgi:hypothetical protein